MTIMMMTTIMLLLIIITTTTTLSQQTAVYGQESILLDEPNENTDRLLAEVMRQLQNITQDHDSFSFIRIHDDGMISISFDNGTTGSFEDLNDDTAIITRHSYLPELGYEFRGDDIIAPNGTELFQ